MQVGLQVNKKRVFLRTLDGSIILYEESFFNKNVSSHIIKNTKILNMKKIKVKEFINNNK